MNLPLERKQNILKEIKGSPYIPEKVSLEIGNDDKVEVWWEDKTGFNNFIGLISFSDLLIFSDEEIYSELSKLVENFNKKKNLERLIKSFDEDKTIKELDKLMIESKLYLQEYLDLLKKLKF